MGNRFPTGSAKAIRSFTPGLRYRCHSIGSHGSNRWENHDGQDDASCQNGKAEGHGKNFPQRRNQDRHTHKAIDNGGNPRKELDGRLNQTAPLWRCNFCHVNRRSHTEGQRNKQCQCTGYERTCHKHGGSDLSTTFCCIARLPLTGK